MLAAGSADLISRVLEAVAASVQPSPPIPDDTRALLANGPLDNALVAGFLIGYRDRTRAAYLADLRGFHVWVCRGRDWAVGCASHRC
jgi:hypothetical protein